MSYHRLRVIGMTIISWNRSRSTHKVVGYSHDIDATIIISLSISFKANLKILFSKDIIAQCT